MVRKSSETPPYIPKKGLLEVFEVLQLHKKGDVITKDELHKRGISTHLIYPSLAALKFLKLIDENGTLLGGHEAFSVTNPDIELKKAIVMSAYKDFFDEVNLPLDSLDEIQKKFKEVYGISERLANSAFPIFEFLCKEAEIKLLKEKNELKEMIKEARILIEEEEKGEKKEEEKKVEEKKEDESEEEILLKTFMKEKIPVLITLQINKYTTEKDVIKMVKTAKKALLYLQKGETGD